MKVKVLAFIAAAVLAAVAAGSAGAMIPPTDNCTDACQTDVSVPAQPADDPGVDQTDPSSADDPSTGPGDGNDGGTAGSIDHSDWCGDPNGICDPSNNGQDGNWEYVRCNTDGSVSLADPEYVADGGFAANSNCSDYTVLLPPADTSGGVDGGGSGDDGSSSSGNGNSNDNGGGAYPTILSGVDLHSLSADPAMDPDPTLYATEVQCPDGSIWAVPFDDTFSCPIR